MKDRTVLFVSPRIPYPLMDGSALRQFHVLRGYAKVASVKLVAFFWHRGELEGAEFWRGEGVDVTALPLIEAAGFDGRALWRRRVQQAMTLLPVTAVAFRSAAMGAAVQQGAGNASLLHAYRLWVVPNVKVALRERGSRLRFVLDLDEVETITRRRALALSSAATQRRRVLERIDLLRLRQYQARVVARADRFFVCSGLDQARVGRTNGVVIPNGATVPASPLPEHVDGPTILLLGLLSYEPNVDAVQYFLREVLPLIRASVPDVRVLVVGKDPTPEVLGVHDGGMIEVAASVPSVEPYYRRATISVTPLRMGGGTRIRILESFALGRAVVSTTIGCEGLYVRDGTHLLVADTPERFARACVRLLGHPEERGRLVANARRLVEETYSWDQVENRVATVAETLLGGGR